MTKAKKQNLLLSLLSVFLLALVAATPSFAQEVPQTRADIQMSFAPLVKKSAPAVVNIYAKRVVRERMRVISPLFNDPFFGQFFGQGFGNDMGGPVRERIQNSLGSGVIVDPAGQIATNTHVIKGATEITAVLQDGREFDAEKVLVDEKTDLAILRIDPKGEKLAALPLADSDAIEVGDLVLAIGNPFGVGQTVTSGIVSATARTGMGGYMDYRYFIQTDAAINPGNSGGALIDMQGRLMGINTMIFTRDGGSVGIGFAVPANMVRTVIDASNRGGKLVRPWTGLSGQPVTSDMMAALGLNRARGALINRVNPKGPAAKAGIRIGDVILSINGHDIQDPEALKFRLATVPVGGDIHLMVSRAGKSFDVKMKAEAAPETPPRQAMTVSGNNPLSGATLGNLSPALADEIDLHDDSEGVAVIEVAAGTPAARLGLRTGDIIQMLNGADIPSMTELKAALGASQNIRRWQVQLRRGAQVMNLMITL
ncbi:MAG TPA: Do family serine endopeptidase [Alphaproteobacteria bacterium]|nr:serine protease [Rhodospirillaceae bacterium]HRJ67878.1 Do family serine endopeptidase [Alphaproteobacteria bacterium]